MEIPKQLKIGVHLVEIKVLPKVFIPEEECGSFDFDTNTIIIDENLPLDRQWETLLHEIFHAINSTYGSDLTEHAIIDFWAVALYQILKENNLLK